MFGSLGAVTFEVVNSPQRFIAKKQYHYDKLAVLGGTPPALQWIYDDLEVLRLEFLFHQLFTSPLTAEQALEAIAQAHDAVPLVFSNGQHEGNFVIISLERTNVWCSDQGDTIAVQMVAELMEYGATLPVGAPTSIPTNTPGLLSSTSTSPNSSQATECSGITSVPPQNIPAAPAGLQATQLPTGTPLFPTIPKLPYIPSVGQIPVSTSFASVSLSLSTRWGTGL